jgi:sugar transferase (PEP-CTERM/EpsH1 system associated)
MREFWPDCANEAMRILYFAPKECWPPDTGAKLRNYYLARELASRASLTYLGFSEDNSLSSDTGRDISDSLARLETVCERVVIVPRKSGYEPLKIIRGAVGRTPLTTLNYTTRPMARLLAQLLDEKDFDAVQIESLLLAQYLPIIGSARSRPAILCDWHNIDSDVMLQYSRRAAGAARKMYARLTARRMADLEKRVAQAFDAHAVVSPADRSRLLEIAPGARVFVIDNGVDVNHYSEATPGRQEIARRSRVIFVGSMDYHANVDAVLHFARDIWPEIHSRDPRMVFTIVGRNPADEVHALAQLPGIEVTGTVEDVRPFYRDAVAAVVPLRVGGGSRLKILEAMAASVPVISSRLGAEGIEARAGEHILIADTSDDFCRAIFNIAQDEPLRESLSRAGLRLVREKYDWSAIGARLFDVHLKTVSQATAAAKVGA